MMICLQKTAFECIEVIDTFKTKYRDFYGEDINKYQKIMKLRSFLNTTTLFRQSGLKIKLSSTILALISHLFNIHRRSEDVPQNIKIASQYQSGANGNREMCA